VSRYYYFAATLPGLQWGSAPPSSSEEFLLRAARNLEASDVAVLEKASLSSVSWENMRDEGLIKRGDLLDRYYAWERGLRNELVRLRAQRLGWDAGKFLHPKALGDETTCIRAASAAFLAADPLESELVLERERWAYIDSLAPYQSFDMSSLVAYRLKLLILERIASFDVERGEEEYRLLYAAILNAGAITR
jgi:hypothetical protein